MIGVFFFGAPLLGAQTEGLIYSEDTVFIVEEGVVRVETTATMTNTTVERREGDSIFFSFFDELFLVTPIGVENLVISSAGATLSSTASPIDEFFELRAVPLPTQLRSGQSRTFEVSFDLPAGELRGDGLFFSNPAHSAFALWSFSDPGQGSLTLRVPPEVQLNDVGNSLRLSGSDDGFTFWEPIDFEVPTDLFAYVTVTNDRALESERFTVAGQDIEVNSWPGDDIWADFAAETIRSGLPVLEELIGLEVPDQSTLEVTESVTPYFFGYAGWYNPVDTSIDIGNDLDDAVMLHELSHAWFNIDLFTDRWIVEGLAEEFTFRAQAELNLEQETPPAVPRLTDRGAQALQDWDSALAGRTNSEEFQDQEAYGYETSWYTVRQIVDIIGLDGMQAVLADVDQSRPSYPSGDASETSSARDDWRRLLDLTSSYATTEEAERLEQLFSDFVANEAGIETLERRRQARIDYEILSERNPQWEVSPSIRTALERWDFDTADLLLEQARAVQDRYLQLQAEVDGTNIVVSNAPQLAYEQGETNFDEALRLLDGQFRSVEAISSMQESVERVLTFRQRIGFVGRDDPPELLTGALEALADDDFVRVDQTAAEFDSILLDADRSGALRLTIVFLVSALVLMAVAFVAWRSSHQAAQLAASLEGETAGTSTASDGDADIESAPDSDSDLAA